MTKARPAGEAARILWTQPREPDSPLNDRLLARLDFYTSSINLTAYEDGVPQSTWPVSPRDLAQTLTSNVKVHSGLLPEGTLWKTLTPAGPPKYALWCPPQKRRVAIVAQYGQPTDRYEIPMPGMVFVCSPAEPPAVYAAKARPESDTWPLYQAPVFNTYASGHTCQGTHEYPDDVTQIPDHFFTAWFTTHGNDSNRSRRHPNSLISLWKELDGEDEFPLDDMVHWGPITEAMAL